VEAQVHRLGASSVELASVNGTGADHPSDSKAELEVPPYTAVSAMTLATRAHHRIVGHDLHGELAGGGARIKLSNVNGTIEIHHAAITVRLAQ